MKISYFSIFKYSIYSLLALNIALFFLHKTWQEGVDALGWVLLLSIFEWETRQVGAIESLRSWQKRLLNVMQAVAYLLILYPWLHYGLTAEWLDFINASLWLGVVGTIYADIQWNISESVQYKRSFYSLKLFLYTTLLVVAIIWGFQGELLDFYDAFLWIVCFFVIELNLFNYSAHSNGKPSAIPDSSEFHE